MVGSGTTASSRAATDARPVAARIGEIARDIARGGLAGIVVGLLVAGLGGRVVMRIATILHEDAVGMITENGEVVGDITIGGTAALMVFGGLGMGLLAGTIWVIVGPWLPGRGAARALIAGLAAIALGTPALVQRTNPDFAMLGRDPLVVALLIGLVGLVGASMAVVDDALDARLPRSRDGFGASTGAYLVITVLGLVLILPVAILMLLAQDEYDAAIRAGWGLLAVGGCTVTWWGLRIIGRTTQPRALRIAASVALAAAVALGLATGLPAVLGAVGVRA